MDGPRGLDLIEKVTIEGGITTSTADDTKLKAYLSPLTQLTQERLPTHAGHVSLILLETPVVQALSRHGTSGSYHTLCEALRACTGHNAQGSRSVVAACALIPGYGESEVNNDYYHTEVLRSFFVRRALVLENGKLRGNFNVSAYGLELIDSTAPLGHVKLYNKGRAFSRCILNFYEDEDEYRPDYISELTPAQLTELKEYRESKDVEQVRKVLTDAFNVARAWVSPLAEKIPVFFVDTVTPRETAQQARYDAGVKFAEEFARNWQYRGNPVLSVEFIVVPPRVYTGEEDPKWNVEDDDRERITRYYDRYAVVVVDTTAIVYNWQTWPVSDRALPPLAAISTWTTPTPTPANISTLLSSARDLLPTTHAGPVPVFVWTPPGVTAPTLDAISDLREAIDSPPAPGGATTFMLAEYAPVTDHDIAFAASAAHEYELARAVTAADTPTPVVGVPRYAWCYSRDAAANMAGLMYSVVCLGTQVVVDVFVQRWPAVAAPEDVGGREVQLMDVLVPEGPEREVGESRGGMVGAALLWSAVEELGSREVKCHAANVYAISGDVGGEGLERAVGKQAFVQVVAALRVLSEGFGMKVGGDVVDLGVDKWTMGRMALWATGTGRLGEKLW
ncbi:hypothetical protein P167DRAFT_540174 [Morchella conica CCBAS932]|uniref:Uncharacterized protein n=1 Tax=Morchella conica CCBAS932 TaxID=1392247 RepID=A0A3N4KA32_9PEZI|nr:hypothetical protein P167DRAFT_540174 [Morchella conica CCBAS932]